MVFSELYSLKEIKKRYSDIEITEKQRNAVKEWLVLLDNNQLQKEEENYLNFMNIILRDLLSYPETEIQKGFEQNNVEFSFKDKDDKTVVVFEAKGTKTKDLFSKQDYGKKEQETPIIQTLTYMARIPARFGVTTNYKKFVLLDASEGDSKCHRFDFKDIENNHDRLREFIGIFSYSKLILEPDKDELYDASISAEKEFTKEFYKLYHETRLMLKKAFEAKEHVTKNEAIYYTQIFPNRLIFIFFIEDRGHIPDARLFTNRILHLLQAGQSTEHSRKIYDDISELFIAFNKGSKVLGVQEYNGGLFDGIIPNKIFFYDLQDPSFFSDVRQYSKLSKSIKLDEKSEKILQQFQNQINPIITNLLIMDSFDFNSEVNVNILGHIFEQSISDIEALKEKKDSRRKKEGVYYTPEEITSYLCRNTILPYLSKSGKTTIFGLIQEYKENIEELEAKFDDLKILDPACGSGAFLNKAIDILLDLHHQIQIHKGSEQTTAGQKQLTEWNETDRALAIIERNIYGVDINQESVDISKLSLFLKIASPTRKLTNLSNYLKVGNSIVEDRSLDQKGFLWENEFPEVLKIDKFDIVIGNPPYGEEIPKDYKKYFKENYASATGRYDSYFYFIEKGISFLRDQGELGFIVPENY